MNSLSTPTGRTNILDLMLKLEQKSAKIADFPEIHDLLKFLEKKPHLRKLAFLMLLDDDAG